MRVPPASERNTPAFRSVLDGRPRMLTIDLGGDLWAAYDARTASLYKVWRDGVSLEGAVYDYRHGPQPRALGPAYVLRTGRSAWRLVVSGEVVRPQVRYRGHRVEPDVVVVLSELRSGDIEIRLEEEIRRVAGPAPTIEWRYRASNVPADVAVEHLVDLDSLEAPPETDGPLRDVRHGPESRFRARLVVAANDETRLRARFGPPSVEPDVRPDVDEVWTKMETMGCPSCHAAEARTVGPALMDIAERYDADPDTVDRLATKVRLGGGGVWGDAVMPANESLERGEAEQLVMYILALDGEDAAARRYAAAQDDLPSLWEIMVEHGPRTLGAWVNGSLEDLFDLREKTAGDGAPLDAVHPSFDVESLEVVGFEPKVGGMDFLANGDLLVSTWDVDGAVYRVSGLEPNGSAKARRIAEGLGEPLGLHVVDDEIYVLQKHELTRLVDSDGDGVTDDYETVANDWGATGNFHEFAFGLVAEPDGFLATLSSGVAPGGNSATSQPVDRGAVIRIGYDGRVESVARGLRTPNGIGPGVDGEIFVADNQGAWLPASKIVHVRPGAFYGFRDVDPEGDAELPETPPVVWLPQDDIGNSPSEPVPLDLGPYRGQMIHGDVTHGGLKRVFAERVGGELQGAVFRFSQGLAGGVNRLRWGPDGKLYVGEVGNPGNWGHVGHRWFGLERLSYNGESVFEMLAVRARPDGFEIEMTESLAAGAGVDPADYEIRQWRYEPTASYGGPKVDLEYLDAKAVHISEDGRRVSLRIPGLRAGSVVHLRLDPGTVQSETGASLWTTETWYTLNRIPASSTGHPSENRNTLLKRDRGQAS